MIQWLLMLLFFCTATFSFTMQIHAHEFRLRANHIFWKNQEAGTEKEIDFGRGVAAKILGKYPILKDEEKVNYVSQIGTCLLYTSPSPRDRTRSRMPSSA